MKKTFLVLFLFNSALLFSLDCYSYNYNPNVMYAIAISPSQFYEEEFTVGLLEIDPSGDARWTISTRTIIEEDNTFKSKIDVNFPIILLNKDNSIDVEINRKNNVILHLERVNKLTYRNCDISIPSVFFN